MSRSIATTAAAVPAATDYITAAIQSNAPVETLERLMALKERHDAAEAKRAFIEAMQQFQTIKPDLPRSSEVSFNKTAYKFCPLPVIEKALRQPLSDCGLSYRFENLSNDTQFGIRCVITHAAGHSEKTEMFAPKDDSGNKNQIQAIGSTSTYLMRYTLIAAFALTTADEDNDGQSNSDMPYQMLMKHNEVLRRHLKAVEVIKSAMAEKDYYTAVSIFDSMPEDDRNALWVAPTKGGIFTTEERAAMKCNEFHAARMEFLAEKNSGKVPA